MHTKATQKKKKPSSRRTHTSHRQDAAAGCTLNEAVAERTRPPSPPPPHTPQAATRVHRKGRRERFHRSPHAHTQTHTHTLMDSARDAATKTSASYSPPPPLSLKFSHLPNRHKTHTHLNTRRYAQEVEEKTCAAPQDGSGLRTATKMARRERGAQESEKQPTRAKEHGAGRKQNTHTRIDVHGRQHEY